MKGKAFALKERMTTEVVVLLLLMVFQSFAFFQGGNPLSNSLFVSIINVISVALIIYLVSSSRNKFINTGDNFMLALCAFINWFFILINSYGHANIFSILSPIILALFCFLNKDSKIKMYEAFRIVMAIMSFLGIIACVLYLLGVPPLSFTDYYDIESSSEYADYGFAYLVVDHTVFYRLCGLFNEPGMFATLAALTLIADECRFNFVNITIFIACIFTFSVAFVALMLIYLFLRLIVVRNIWSKFLILCIGLGVLFLSTMEFEDDNVVYMLSRLQLEDGKLAGDSRASSQLDFYWKRLISDSSKLWFGYGSYIGQTRSSSYKMLIVNYGLLGLLCIFTPFFLTALRIAKKNWDAIALIFVFLVSMYQRPLVFNLAYFIVLFGGIYSIRQKNVLYNNSQK